MKNIDWIRNMPTGNLAAFMCMSSGSCPYPDCAECPLREKDDCVKTSVEKWLESEVSGND